MITLWVYLKFRFRFAEEIPCAQPMRPFFGNGLEFAQKNSYQIFINLARAFEANKRIFKLSFGPIPVICPTHPDLMQKVLTDVASMEKPFVYKFLRVDKGLMAAEYEIWRSHRKVLNPTFNTRILNSFIPIFTDCIDTMIRSMKEQNAPGKPLNVLQFTSPCTLGMVCRTSLGSKVLEREGTQRFIEGLDCILHQMGLRLFNVNLYPNWVYRFTRFYRAEMEARKYCYAFTDKIIKDKQMELSKEISSGEFDNSSITDAGEEEESDMMFYKKPQIFIDQLLTIPLPNGQAFSYEEIRDHIYTMIAAGNETSATQAAHTVLLLAMHPEIQDKAVAELKNVFPTPDTEYSPEVLKNLVYLECIIKESLRLCPVGAVFGRKTLSNLQLDQYVIPKGNIIVMNVYVLHRRKDFWGEDADFFNPDRFSPENSRNRHPFAYLPFSGGARGCIGSRYGIMSIKAMLAEMLRNFKITTDIKYEDLQFKFKFTTQLAFEHRVFLEPRNLYQ